MQTVVIMQKDNEMKLYLDIFNVCILILGKVSRGSYKILNH